MRSRLIATIALVLATIQAACAGASPSSVAIAVDHPRALIDEPLRITINGLSPDAAVTVRATTVDDAGRPWASIASFSADDRGQLDLARAIPHAGTYSGADRMGLFWSMRSNSPTPIPYGLPPSTGLAITISVEANGATVARRVVRRLPRATGVTVHTASIDRDGFLGEFDSPAVTSVGHPAVLLLGGSEGGLAPILSVLAGLLASHGYPALAIAYFGAPGLPQGLNDIPLEYFANALTWLRHQPGVDSTHVFTLGISRGSEAAQLLGVYYPQLVQGVMALVPSDVAICSFPGCGGAAWTLHGTALPYTRQPNNPYPSDNSAAIIPVGRIRGPLFLMCAGDDQVWWSCIYAEAINSELNASHDPYPHPLLRYAHAGHGVGTLVPYVLGDPAPFQLPGATQRARADAWPRLLSFLAQPH